MSTNHTSDLPQGDLSQTEGQAPAVDGLVARDTGGESVQVAQAGTTASDGAQVIEVAPGSQIDLSDISLDGATMTLDGQDLILSLADGTQVVLQDFITASLSDNPPSFQFNGDLQMSAADMLASSSPAAGGELPPGVNPQAGTAGTQDDDGSTVAPEAQGPIGPGAEPLGPLGPTSLAFTAPVPELDVVFLPAAAVLPTEEEEAQVCEEITCDQLFSAYMASWNGPVGTRISAPDLDDDDIVSGSDYWLYQGTSGDDLMQGNGDDWGQVILGHGGDDTIVAGEYPFINVVHGDTPDFEFFNNKPSLLVGEGEPDFGEPGNDIIFGSDNPEQLEILIGGEGNDYLDGQAGYELIVGDELALSLSFGEGELPKDQIALAAVPSSGDEIWFGNANLYASDPFASSDNYNDVLFSGQGQAIMVGDVAATGLDLDGCFKIGYNGQVSLSASFYDGGSVTAYNDFIKAEDPVFDTKPDLPTELLVLSSEGGDLPQFGPYYNYMVGDVLAVGSTNGIYFNTYGEGGGDGGSAYTFNDYLCGADGADLMVGDLAQVGWHTFDQYISLNVSGGNSISDQTFESHNDILLGYGGDDHMVGDVYTTGIHWSDINLNVNNYANAYSGNANNNTYDAFNDQFRPGLGDDTTVGDVHVDGFGNKIDLFAGNKASGAVEGESGVSADNNTFYAYNDEICDDGGAVAIGDVLAEGKVNDVHLAVANEALGSYGEGNSASNNTFTVFSDILHSQHEIEVADGGYGVDGYGEGSLLIGDVYVDNWFSHKGDSDVELSVKNKAYGWNGYSGEYGAEGGEANNNTFNAFNDWIVGTSQDDEMVGDVLAEHMDGSIDLTVENAAGGAGNSEGGAGTANGNIFNAFNDTIAGVNGADDVVGDVSAHGWLGDDDLKLKISNLAEGGYGGYGGYGEGAEDGGGVANGNTFNAFNDEITLGDAVNYKDTNHVTGDVYFTGQTDGKIDLSVSNTALGGAYYGYNGSGSADDNTFNAFNDTVTVGDGHASVVGDLEFDGKAKGYIDLGVSNTAASGSYGTDDAASASNNTFNVFNDMVAMGYGEGYLVGDVSAEGKIKDLDLTVENFAGGGYGEEGANASNNTFNAFNDTLTGIGSFEYGGLIKDDGSELIGDVDIDRSRHSHHDSELNLSVSNEAGGLNYTFGYYGEGGQANENTFNAFNDTLQTGLGNHTLIGDVRLEDWEGDATLSASNEVSESYYGVVGQANSNTFNVFNDTMSAGDGYDFAVGDASVEGKLGRHDDLELSISNFAAGGYGEGGEANGNDFDAFNDSIDIGTGGGTAVGDVYFHGKGKGDIKLEVSNAAAGLMAYSLSPTGQDGGDASNNTFDAFNDTITGGMNSYYEMGYEVPTLTALSEVSESRDPGDTLVGDVLFDGKGHHGVPDLKLKVENTAGDNLESSGSYGEGGTADNNTFNAFNDTIVGGPDEGPEEPVSVGEGEFSELVLEQNTLVGDVMAGDAGEIKLKVTNSTNEDLSGGNNPYSSASNNTFHAFNDSLTLGYGEGTLVGDVYAEGGCGEGCDDGLQIKMEASNHAGYASAATDNTFTVFNDTLTGHDFNDSLVGDVHIWGGALDSLEMKLENSTYYSTNENTDNYDATRTTFDAFNDSLTGGDGSNELVGDVFFAGYKNCETDIGLSALGTYGTVGEGDDEFSDKFTAWSDTIVGGADYDKMVGDLKIGNSNGLINTAILAGTTFDDSYAGVTGDYNLFNDNMSGGGDGDDMVGDIWTWGDGTMEISAQAWYEYANTEDDYASFDMFNDGMTGGAGGDWMVGDMYFHDFGLDSASTVDVLAYGEGTFTMFNDNMDGGVGSDIMIGDIHFSDFGYGEGDSGDGFQVEVNHAGNLSDDFSLFNDTMDGGDGEDYMVGDVLFDDFNAKFEVDVEGHSEGFGDITMFSDTMTGGDGNDVMFGDFFFGDEGDLVSFNFGEGSADFEAIFDSGVNHGLGIIEFDVYVDSDILNEGYDGSIFADKLMGGDGDDHLIGQLGADELTGGAGADTFWYGAGDGSNPSDNAMFNGNDDVSDLESVINGGDVITDYEAGVDAIGLYGGLTDGDLIFTQIGSDVRISIDNPGSEILATVLNATESDLDFVTVL